MMGLHIDRRGAVGGLAATMALFMAARADAQQPGGAEATVVDAFLTAYQARDTNAMYELMAEDVYFEDPTFHLLARNREEMRPIFEPVASLFQSIVITPHNRILAQPWIVSQQTIAGRMTRPDGEVRDLEVKGVSLFEVRAGKIVRWYDYYDVLSFRQQTR